MDNYLTTIRISIMGNYLTTKNEVMYDLMTLKMKWEHKSLKQGFHTCPVFMTLINHCTVGYRMGVRIVRSGGYRELH